MPPASKLIKFIAACGFALAACGVALAADTGSSDLSYTPPQAPRAPDAGYLLLRLFGMTLFVLLICAAILWLIRLSRKPRLAGLANPNRLKQLGEADLWSRCSVHLLDAAGHQVLIAIDPGGIKTCQLVDDTFGEALTAAGLPPQPTPVPAPAPTGPTVAEMMAFLNSRRAA